MAEDGPPHEAHRDRRRGGDRADVQAMQAGDGVFTHPEAFTVAIPLQLAVAGIGPQAVTAVFQKLQAPVPVIATQLGVGRCAADGRVARLRVQPRPAGQAGEVLQQHIEGCHRWFALFHQPIAETATHGAEFQQFQGVGGHEQHLGGPPWQVG